MFSVPYLVLPASQITLAPTSTPIFCLERQQSFLNPVHDEHKKHLRTEVKKPQQNH